MTTTQRRPIRRALISVFDKTGIVDLARTLAEHDVEIVSTGSTGATIREAGIDVTDVETVTGFPEMLDGRVKTLHPRVHAGLLADQRLDSHRAQLAEHGIEPFDLVVVNLYPFSETVAAGGSFDEIIEKIDIGGPSMVRGAAKNFASLAVVVDPENYSTAAEAVAVGGFSLSERQELATIAFTRTAEYDEAISDWMLFQLAEDDAEAEEQEDEQEAESLNILDLSEEDAAELGFTATLRYGENPHQRARLAVTDPDAPGIAGAEQLGGKAMSYNNYVDSDAAVRAAYDHERPCVAVVKHNNPCGLAVAEESEDIAVAHLRAHGTDPLSAYGGVIATNRTVTLAMAQQVKPIFTEVILAPAYEDAALELLRTKKNLRILRLQGEYSREIEMREIWGGLLIQDADVIDADGDDPSAWTLAAGEAADEATLADLAFAWRSVRAVKSNAILLASGGAAVGLGMGQVNRLDSCRLAVSRANSLGEHAEGEAAPERARGAVAASDAFFPFADGAQILLDAGVRAIVQPGGSIRDEEVIEACRAAGATLYLTGTRHFAH
ncbi:bifunctional phosphoribosylaminoimidazolecarboxamide formyltransferase/IMP cyclohydrolase [Brachybacterium alimentarium]|uniref:Bifunctional purine biosynthesis protein PurH n=1 Tax=Brachybacterium alimentarium TaxID=47845 RepID=A0A2A3YM08_9MICO|nr:bifunctional phosphoribosylaminoimidazolecarboxamide formyltransferase/IMP cyclohydrolase [Brachybacterium alimentarium]PCC40337.1 bifunctional phosphoribosylaminoimidazolecarboxamide formyltransferase/IMP cyclohydrolase [Brachybacterium alimentarium]RCS68090.1 bifunctional phosphoribosylaminoimidazolecarboxamide formyltransferase/IMP cyclohydrolase PurH [Brachybacterium alimentarium]RCS79521.1 bifunctional phosphoribosylaminoimidazolecarboxamide formyltransferase/IMP cyclohydrolase PurH [Bra